MNGKEFTIRDLEEARRRGYRRRSNRSMIKERDLLITFALIVACWLVRELFLSL